MKFLKTDGIIIREANSGESDKVLTVISSELGRITVFVKGARRSKSRNLLSGQFLTYSEFVLFRGRDMYNLSSSQTKISFYNLCLDISKLVYSTYLCDILNDVIVENQTCREIIKLLLVTLYRIDSNHPNLKLITRSYELRLLCYLGYTPLVNSCVSCSNFESKNYYFSLLKYGIICDKCGSKDLYAVQIKYSTVMSLRYIIYSDIKKIHDFNVSEEVLNELNIVITKYLTKCLEKKYNKLDFITKLEEFNSE